MTLKLREMEVLHAVVKTGTMSAAARQLSTSQPAVSQLVGMLEKRLGVSLFLREGNRVKPTPELIELFKELDLIFNTVESARRLGALLHLGAGRILRIGAIPSIAGALLPRAIKAMRQAYPELRFLTRFHDPAPIKDAIIRRDFDLGLMYAEEQREGLETVELCRAPVVCILRADDPLASQAVITPALLANQPLISFASTGSSIGQSLDDIFAAVGLPREMVVQTQHSHVTPDFVRQGLGIAVTDPFFIGSGSLDGLAIRPFEPTRLLAPRLVHVQARQLSDLEMLFIEHLKNAGAAWVEEHGFAQYGTAEPPT